MSFWWGNIYGTFCLLFPIHLLVHDGFFVIVTLISSLRLPIAIVEISMYFCYSLWRFSLSFIVLLKGYGLHSCSSGFGYQGSAKVCAHLLQWMLNHIYFEMILLLSDAAPVGLKQWRESFKQNVIVHDRNLYMCLPWPESLSISEHDLSLTHSYFICFLLTFFRNKE